MVVSDDSARFLGRGLYSVRDATWLARLPVVGAREEYPGALDSSTVRRWASRVLDRDFRDYRQGWVLSFLDLVELRAIDRLGRLDIPLGRIRVQHDNLKRMYGLRHPFASGRFKTRTDGRDIYVQDAHGTTNARDFQMQLEDVVEKFLQDIVYEEGGDELARTWWPLGLGGPIVIDPDRSFGKPIIAATGVPISAIEESIAAGQSDDEIADWWEVDRGDVEAVREFRRILTAA